MGLKEAIQTVRPVVVQINVNRNVMGTGFFIDQEGHVATAWHVVENHASPTVALAQPDPENMRGNFSGVNATVVAKDERQDLAILKMARNPFAGEMRSGFLINGHEIDLLCGTTELDVSRPEDGESIAISGYPLANPVLVTTSGAIAAAWNYDVQEVSVPGAPAGFTMPDLSDVYLADVQANPGNSGGPAYRVSDGAIIGVCIQTRLAPTFNTAGAPSQVVANAGLTVIRPVRYLADLITTAGI